MGSRQHMPKGPGPAQRSPSHAPALPPEAAGSRGQPGDDPPSRAPACPFPSGFYLCCDWPEDDKQCCHQVHSASGIPAARRIPGLAIWMEDENACCALQAARRRQMRIAMEKSGNVMLIIGYISRERRESLAASDNQPLLQGL